MGFFSKRKERKAEEKADKLRQIVELVEAQPKKFQDESLKEYRQNWTVALVAIRRDVNNWDYVDKALRESKSFQEDAIKENLAVLGKIYPKGIDNLVIAKHYISLLSELSEKERRRYFAPSILKDLEKEEKNRQARKEIDKALAGRREKFSSIFPVEKDEEEKAEEKPEKKPETPQEKLFGLIRTSYITSEGDERLGKITQALETVGTINITDGEGKSLLNNFFHYNRSIIVWRELERWCWKEKLKITEDDLKPFESVKDKTSSDSECFEAVNKYIEKFTDYTDYNKYCDDIREGKIKIVEVPEKLLDKDLCLLYIQKNGKFAYFDIPTKYANDYEICKAVYDMDPAFKNYLPKSIVEKIEENLSSTEESEEK